MTNASLHGKSTHCRQLLLLHDKCTHTWQLLLLHDKFFPCMTVALMYCMTHKLIAWQLLVLHDSCSYCMTNALITWQLRLLHDTWTHSMTVARIAWKLLVLHDICSDCLTVGSIAWQMLFFAWYGWPGISVCSFLVGLGLILGVCHDVLGHRLVDHTQDVVPTLRIAADLKGQWLQF